MSKTKIQWTEAVWNPLAGCTKVSPGCAHCYAERMAKRLKAIGRPEYQDVVDDKGRWTGRVTLVPERLEQPLKWKKPRMIFVNSMSDLFHEDVPDDFILAVFSIMLEAERHTFQLLTKRPERMRKICNALIYPLPNVWLGASVEDQKRADERILWLFQTPAAVRFLSIEPMLGPIDLQMSTWFNNNSETKHNLPPNGVGLDWVIAGCESGPKARPASPDWFRSLRDQCQAAGVAFFLKQMVIDGKLVHTPELDGRRWVEYPEAKR